ncbi:MAG: hypothetical protein N3D12_05925 [Candidatus Methanomethyliaceae archaeon]|nr:hypothetical protein [Candidatus Methanomethyliaceae archaeon]
MNDHKGFTFTLTALTLFLVLTSYSIMMLYFIAPVYIEPVPNVDLSREIYRSILRGAGAAASRNTNPEVAAEVYINASLNALGALVKEGMVIPPFDGRGLGRLEPSQGGDTNYGVIYRSSSGTGGTIRILNLPPDSEVFLADQDLNIISKSTTGTLNFNREKGNYYIIAYTKDSQAWAYSGTISVSYKYMLQGSSITSAAWSPPSGFPYILVYGVPQLSLVRVFNASGATVGESLRDLSSNVTTVLVPLASFNGRISIIAPNAWYFGIVEGGEVFVYD